MLKIRRIFVLLIIINLLAGFSLAQELTPKETARIKNRISKLQKNIVNLKKRLPKTKSKKIRADILSRIDEHQTEINKLKQKLKAKATLKPSPARAVTAEAAATPEASPLVEVVPEVRVLPEVEERLEEEKVVQIYKRLRFEIGGVTGLFGGATTLLGEVRFPVRFVLGPATASFRISAGLAQSRDASQRYVPVNVDAILNFPPGWFTGVENYIGMGLNYVLRTSEGKSGTVGGEVFYGVESEGFGGIVFGEMGYGALRTGFTPSHKGITVMVGYRRTWGY